MQYRDDLPYVLKGLAFKIPPQSKIGVVGRTGAGKSSILQALFRLTDFEGTILIDGLNSKHIGLQTLRGGLALIPQMPFLFDGSIRENLDPFI